MYAITGITGKVGGVAARTLLAAGQRIRAVVRNADKGGLWSDLGCQVAIAQMEDAAALTRQPSREPAGNVHRLVGCVAGRDRDEDAAELESGRDPVLDRCAHGLRQGHLEDAAAVRQALDATRPARVVCLSTIGAQALQSNLLSQRTLMEQALSKLPMPVTFLRPAWFMENLSWDIDQAREQGVVS